MSLTRREKYAKNVGGYADKQKARAAKYRKDNPEEFKATQRNISRRLSVRYCRARASAKQRKIHFDLSREEFCANAVLPCIYCGRVPNGTETGSWADRVEQDRAIGYIASNIVPCCGPCNVGRGVNFTFAEFMLLSPVLRQIRLARGC